MSTTPTIGAALHSFFSGFGIPAYPHTAVPDQAAMPYLTYTPIFGYAFDQAGITVNLWYRTESEASPNAKAAEIAETLGDGGVMVACQGGGVWLTRGSPFCQSLTDEDDNTIKRRYINVTAQFVTA